MPALIKITYFYTFKMIFNISNLKTFLLYLINENI